MKISAGKKYSLLKGIN